MRLVRQALLSACSVKNLARTQISRGLFSLPRRQASHAQTKRSRWKAASFSRTFKPDPMDWLKPIDSLEKLRLPHQCAGPKVQWAFATEHQFDLLLLDDPNFQVEPFLVGSDFLFEGHLIVDP